MADPLSYTLLLHLQYYKLLSHRLHQNLLLLSVLQILHLLSMSNMVNLHIPHLSHLVYHHCSYLIVIHYIGLLLLLHLHHQLIHILYRYHLQQHHLLNQSLHIPLRCKYVMYQMLLIHHLLTSNLLQLEELVIKYLDVPYLYNLLR